MPNYQPTPPVITLQLQSALDECAAQVGITTGEHYTLDGQWHKATPADKRDRGKLFYRGEWRTSRRGRDYPTVTFYNFRGGGQSIYFNGYDIARPTADQSHRPTPDYTQLKPPDPTKQRPRLRRIITGALPLDHPQAAPARAYLTARGLAATLADLPAALRCHPALDYWHITDSGPVRLGNYPALLAIVTRPSGAG